MSKDPYKQLFADPRDVLTDECMVEEMYYSHLSRHPLHILNQAAGTDLYGDPAAEPVYDRTIEMPMFIKLDPQETLLNKYGIDLRREAVIWFSRKICHDLGIEPKIGDRVDFTFRTAVGGVVNEHLIINEFSPWDFQRQLVDHYGFIAGADRTQKKYKPDPTGTPEDPKPLPFDVKCLKDL